MKAHSIITRATLLLSLCLHLPAETVWERDAWAGRIEQAVFSTNSERVACRMHDGRVLLRNVETGETLFQENTAPYAATGLAISENGEQIAWGDYSGKLHTWTESSGTVSAYIGQMAIGGIAFSGNAEVIACAGDGIRLFLRDRSSLQAVRSPAIGLEQVPTLAVDRSGNRILVGDHSGRLLLYDQNTGTQRSVRLSDSGVSGGCFLDQRDRQIILAWNTDGRLWVMDDALTVFGVMEFGTAWVTAFLPDPEENRVLFGTGDGHFLGVRIVETAVSMEILGEMDGAVTGIGKRNDGEILAMTSSGELFSFRDGIFALLREPAITGTPLRADFSLRSGIGVLMTNDTTTLIALNDGQTFPVEEFPSSIVLDSAIFHGFTGIGPVYLLLDIETLSVRLASSLFADDYLLESWTPTRVACAPWYPHIALMSADGSVQVLRETGDGLVGLWFDASLIEGLWDDLKFIENGSELLRLRSAPGDQPEGKLDKLGGDRPFHLSVSPEGSLCLVRDPSDSISLSFPDVAPSPDGGMETGWFGHVQAVRDGFVRQRELGWCYPFPVGEWSCFWFPQEGWLSGSADSGGRLFSFESRNWLYLLSGPYGVDWVYDYAILGWRRFRE